MADLPLSLLPTARLCRELARVRSDAGLRILAKHLDLPMDDAETVSFLRSALNDADREMHTMELQARIDDLKDPTHG